MKRQDEHPLTVGPGGKTATRPTDLLDTGQERQDLAGIGARVARDGLLDRTGDLLGQRGRGRPPVADLDRVRPALDPDDRRIAEEPRDGLSLHRGRHHDQDQVVADRLADFAKKRQGQVGVQAPLVELVEHHGADAFEERVVDELAVEDALGDDLDPRLRPDPLFKADLVADPAADCPAVLLGDPARRGPGGDPPGLQAGRARGVRPPSSRPWTSATGTRVVLPAPGGATRTRHLRRRACSTISGRALSIGRGVMEPRFRAFQADRNRHLRQTRFGGRSYVKFEPIPGKSDALGSSSDFIASSGKFDGASGTFGAWLSSKESWHPSPAMMSVLDIGRTAVLA